MGFLTTQSSRNAIPDSIRTVWFASLGLALLGGLIATKIVSAPVSERPAIVDRQTVPQMATLPNALTNSGKSAVHIAELR
jgi:hypothetical protein